MQRTIGLAASLSLAWLICSPVSANADDVPRRKAGLWEITTIGAGSGTNKATTCIGENDKILSPAGSDCSTPEVKRGGEDTVIVTLVCTTEQGKEVISGAFTGDFSTRYRAQVRMTFDPPPKGMVPHMGVTIEGKYLGPDCGTEKAPSEAE